MKKAKYIVVAVALLMSLLPQLAVAEVIYASTDAPPNEGILASLPSGFPLMPKDEIPEGYMVIDDNFPDIWWTDNCVATCHGDRVGYLSNAGFESICRKKIGPSTWTPYIFKLGNYPNDNQPYLGLNDKKDIYPSKLDVIATQAGHYDRSADDWGHVDDYEWTWGLVGSIKDPYHDKLPTRPAHENDCIADFIGAGISNYWGNADGSATVIYDSTGNFLRWRPDTFPWINEARNVDPNTNPYGRSKLDPTYGLSRYVVWTGYWDSDIQSQAVDGTPFDHDVFNYGTQLVKGCKLKSWDPSIPPAAAGATKEDVIRELEAGWPVDIMVIGVTDFGGNGTTPNRNQLHQVIAYGYNKSQIENDPSAPLIMVCRTTWNENYLSTFYSQTNYALIPFPTEAEAGDVDCHSLKRASRGDQWWKVYSTGTFRINDNPRCMSPLPSGTYPDGVYQTPFEIHFNLGSRADHVHYDYGHDPTAASPFITLDSLGQGTLLIDRDCRIRFRSYKNGILPNGYLASKTIKRTFSVFSENKNLKKFSDGDAVSLVNGTVIWADNDRFYVCERDKRLFGIRVLSPSHGLEVGDEVEIVSGTIQTDSPGTSSSDPETIDNQERYIIAQDFVKKSQPSEIITPLGMTCANLGGGDYNPPGAGITGGQKGPTGRIGLNNVGLLVRVAGVVTNIGEGNITVNDGSSFCDREGNPGIKIVGEIPIGLTVNESFITITGVSSLESGTVPSTDLFPIILAREIQIQ